MSDLIDINDRAPDRDTVAASEFLGKLGVPVAPATLRKLRCIGGGPRFRKSMRRALYSEAALIEWAQTKRSPEVRSTSELQPRISKTPSDMRKGRPTAALREIAQSRHQPGDETELDT